MRLSVAACAISLSGCVSIMSGPTTTIDITSTPSGATATIYPAETRFEVVEHNDTTYVVGRREEKPIAIVVTPAQLTLDRQRGGYYLIEFEHETAGDALAALCERQNQWVAADAFLSLFTLFLPILLDSVLPGRDWFYDWSQRPSEVQLNWDNNDPPVCS